MAKQQWQNRIVGYAEVDPATLSANPANFRRHPKRQGDALTGSLNELGWIQDILVNRTTGKMIHGHLRVELALANGAKTVPVKYVELSEAEERLVLATLDPITYLAETDAAALGALLEGVQTGDAALQEMLSKLAEDNGLLKPEPVQDVEPQVDRAEELRQKWGVSSGDMWAMGEHRIVCGDCTDAAVVARVMGGERADCAFTSPPYAVGVDYGETYQDTIDNLRAMLPEMAAACWAAVRDGGYAVMNFGDIASGRNVTETDEPCEYPMALEYWPIFRGMGWLLWARRIWCKPTARVHSPWCIQSNRAPTDWEHLWTFKKPGVPIVKRIDGELRSASGWYQSSQMHGVDVGKGEHGAGMAVGIAQWMVNVHSLAGGSVFEPFSGTGTTIIACEQLGRKCRAVEISPGYVAVALERWAQATGKQPEHLPCFD